MVGDYLDRYNPLTDSPLAVCTRNERAILNDYHFIIECDLFNPIPEDASPADYYRLSLYNIILYNVQLNSQLVLVSAKDLHHARSLRGAEILRLKNEELASKSTRKPSAPKDPRKEIEKLLDSLPQEQREALLLAMSLKEQS